MKKNRIFLIPLTLLFLILAAGSMAMFRQALRYDRSFDRNEDFLYPVMLEGEYHTGTGEWKPFSRETRFDYRTLQNITVRGHFSRDIPAGEKLFLNVCQLWVRIRSGGNEIYYLGPQEGDGNPAQSFGNQWVSVSSPGIRMTDEVELSFGNLYPNAYFIQFDNLLWNMYTGNERMLVSQALHKDAGMLIISAVFLVLTMFLFITGILLLLLHIQGVLQFFLLGICTFFSAVWFATLSPALSLFLPFPVLLNALYAYSIQCIAISIILLVITNLSGWRRTILFSALIALIAAMLAAIYVHMSGIHDLFSTIDLFSMLDTGIAILMVGCLVYEMRVLKNKSLLIFLRAMIPLVGLGVLEMLNGIVQWLEAGICLGIGLILFAILEWLAILRRISKGLEGEKRALELESELSQSRISMMLSQIQPHFLYNSLVGIKQLCEENPQKVPDALDHFSYYLRGNLDALSNTELILFTEELEHVRDYLYLEKMRFEERLQIQWKLEYEDFMLPPLTLQFVVENAIRHGIMKREEGGTLTIQSAQEEKDIIIIVTDDGIGFSEAETGEAGRTHVGIQNVRNRLEALCGGSLQIRSERNTGTEVTIKIPKKERILS